MTQAGIKGAVIADRGSATAGVATAASTAGTVGPASTLLLCCSFADSHHLDFERQGLAGQWVVQIEGHVFIIDTVDPSRDLLPLGRSQH